MNNKLFLTWLGISLPMVLSPFLLGGVYSHLETGFVIVFVVAAASFFYTGYLLVLKKPVAISVLIVPLGALLVYSIIQLIPVPLSILKILSPKGHYFHMIESAGPRPLTMSIPDTFYSSVRILALILFAFTVSRAVHCGSRKIRQMVLDTILYVSSAVILVSAAVELLQIEKWLYGTLRSTGFLIEPIIVNPNHAAAYFGISGIIALVLALKNDFRRIQILYGAIFFIHTIAVISTVSKGGILAYLVSVIFLLFVQRKVRKKKEPGRVKRLLLTFSVLSALVIAFYSGYTMLEREFVDAGMDRYLEKAQNLKSVKGYFSDFYLTGSGTGSFSKVYPYYQSNPEKHFDQLENEPVQLMLETGVFFTILLFLLFVWALKGGGEKSVPGLSAVVFFVLLHNTVDFNLHNFSTLFPVTALLVLVTRPFFISGWKKKAVLLSAVAVSFLIMLTVSTQTGRKWCGYAPDHNYADLVHLYPADYSLPMKEAVKNMNSGDSAVSATSGQYISAAVMKAPDYYFAYYLAGKYMTKIGSMQCLEFYRKSVAVSDPLTIDLLNRIYRDLKYLHKENEMAGMLKSAPEGSEPVVEKFLRETSAKDSNITKYVLENREIFYIPALNIYMKKGEYSEAERFMNMIEKSGKELLPEHKGRFHMYKGLLYEKKGAYQEAFNEYLAGSSLTGTFYDRLVLAYSSLKLGKKEIEIADAKLKGSEMHSTRTMAQYYRWLSKKEFLDNNFAKGIKDLEKSAEISKDPAMILEIAKVYSRNKMPVRSLENLAKLKKNHPEFRKNEVETFFKKEHSRLSEREAEIFKEILMRQDH